MESWANYDTNTSGWKMRYQNKYTLMWQDLFLEMLSQALTPVAIVYTYVK
jgi:hypothetical protein